MDFKMRMDHEVKEYLPGVTPRRCTVELTDSLLCLHLDRKFEMRTDLSSVNEVRPMENLEPEVFFPLGISAAVERLGADTLAVIGSHEGLVAIDFNESVEGCTSPEATSDEDQPREQASVQMKHLILSLEDPEGFIQTVNKRVRHPAGAEV